MDGPTGPACRPGVGEMEVFLPHDVAFGFGAVIQLQIDTALVWIVPPGIGAAVVGDIFAPRGSNNTAIIRVFEVYG
jgi:hypothetical protein